MSRWDPSIALRLILGGDNAATWHALRALSGGDYSNIGLVTLDAHLDMRDGCRTALRCVNFSKRGSTLITWCSWTGRLLQLAGLRAARPRGRCHGDLARRVAPRAVEEAARRAVAIAGAVDAASTLTSTWTPPNRMAVPACPAARPVA